MLPRPHPAHLGMGRGMNLGSGQARFGARDPGGWPEGGGSSPGSGAAFMRRERWGHRLRFLTLCSAANLQPGWTKSWTPGVLSWDNDTFRPQQVGVWAGPGATSGPQLGCALPEFCSETPTEQPPWSRAWPGRRGPGKGRCCGLSIQRRSSPDLTFMSSRHWTSVPTGHPLATAFPPEPHLVPPLGLSSHLTDVPT